MKKQPKNRDSFSLGEGKVRELMQRNIPIEDELWAEVQRLAAKDDRSASSWVRNAIREKMRREGGVANVEMIYNNASPSAQISE